MSRISVVLLGLAPRCKGPTTLRLWVCIKGFLWRAAHHHVCNIHFHLALHHHLCNIHIISALCFTTQLLNSLIYLPRLNTNPLLVSAVCHYQLQFIVISCACDCFPHMPGSEGKILILSSVAWHPGQ